jgi:hypothetical protein
MTTYSEETQTCCVCGNEQSCSIITSTNTNGAPDLDLRPAMMERATMHAWLQECSQCHFVSGDLTIKSDETKSIVDSEPYRVIVDHDSIPDIAKRFELCAMLNAGNAEIAGTSLLRAAWVCDDADESERSVAYRKRSADLLSKLRPFDDDQEHATIGTMLVDVLRRSGQFDESVKLGTNLLKFKAVKRNEVMTAVLKFELQLCEAADSDCHTLAEAMGDSESKGQEESHGEGT